MNHITIYQGCNRTTSRRSWRNMADAGTTRTTREATVGNQCHLFAQTHTHDISSRGQHLLHARTTSRSLIADDHYITFLHLPVENTSACLFLRIVDASRTRS